MTEHGAEFVKLFGFFLYHRRMDLFAYWDLEHDFPMHCKLHPHQPVGFSPYRGGPDDRWGFGFSYVFSRRAWEAVPFPQNRNHGEDQEFASAVVDRFASVGVQDISRSCIHIIHDSNTSLAYPQQILPGHLRSQLFPYFTR
jgi:hypothetical protein